MNNQDFCIKIIGLSLVPDIQQKLKEIFVKINTKSLESIINNQEIILSSHNNKIIKDIYQKIVDLFNQNLNTKYEIEYINSFSDFSQVGSIVFPLSENTSVYDIISVFTPEDKKIESEIVIDKDIDILESTSCRGCYKRTPIKLAFCINCGFILRDENLEDYQIKFSHLNQVEKIKISKYLSDISDKEYSEIVIDNIGLFPFLFNFKAYPNSITKILEYLDINGIKYHFKINKDFNFEKIISYAYPSVNLGKIHYEYEYINKNLLKIITDTIRKTNLDDLKYILTLVLNEYSQIIETIHLSEDSAQLLFSDLEKELNKLIEKFIFLIKRSQSLRLYLSQTSILKIKYEISDLEREISLNGNSSLLKINQETLKLKKDEIEEISKVVENNQITNAQINSVKSFFSSIKTKINYINTLDNRENKGEIFEINSLKSNIILKIKSVDEILKV